MTATKYKRRAGVRFTYLLRQLHAGGMSQTDIAEAIGCHQTLISKWWWRGGISAELIQKGLRDDVIQGIVDGLGVRSDYLFMATPRDYHKRIRLPTGETRPADPDELDASEFKVLVSNEQFQERRERKEVATLTTRVDGLENKLETVSSQLAQLLAILATDKKSTR